MTYYISMCLGHKNNFYVHLSVIGKVNKHQNKTLQELEGLSLLSVVKSYCACDRLIMQQHPYIFNLLQYNWSYTHNLQDELATDH